MHPAGSVRHVGRAQKDRDPQHFALGVLFPVEADLGVEIVQRLGHGLSLEFDHVGRPRVAVRLDQTIEASFQTLDRQRAEAVGADELQATGEHPEGLRAGAQEEIDRVVSLHTRQHRPAKAPSKAWRPVRRSCRQHRPIDRDDPPAPRAGVGLPGASLLSGWGRAGNSIPAQRCSAPALITIPIVRRRALRSQGFQP